MIKIFNRRHFAVLVVILTGASATADDKVSLIDQLLQQYHDLGQFSGSALVVEAGSTVLSKGYGIANQEWQIANTPDTRFLVGSVTKSFTALAVLQLEEQGKLDLDAAISDYLPWYRDDTGSRVSLRHLLTHTDGIPNYTGNVYFWQSYENGVPYSTAEFVGRYCSGELEFDPGSQYRYGNAGYSILGAIIEAVSGTSYAEAISRQILEPFKMESTGQHREGTTLSRRATGYEVSIDGYRPASPLHKNLRAAGSMYSTVEDLSQYNRALFGGDVISPESMATLFKSREGSVDGTFAYGWNVGELTLDSAIASKPYMATNGEINGFNAAMLRLPEDQHFIVLLNNTGETNLFDIASNIARILYDLPATRPALQLRDTFYAKLRDESVEAAFSFYREQRRSQPDDYLYFPWPMRILANQYVHDGHYEFAIDILKLNLETNPNDSRSLVSLAQVQLQMGATAAAIDSLKTALSLDEANAYAADLLLRLER